MKRWIAVLLLLSTFGALFACGKPTKETPQTPPAEEKPSAEETPPQKTLYRVQVGAYEVKENAQAMVEFLQKVGVAGFIVEVKG